MFRTCLAGSTGRKNDAKIAVWASSHNLLGYIFATKACFDNRKKNLLNCNISPICPHNMVNFGPLTAEICSGVWAPQQISTGFACWQRYCTTLGVSQTLRRHLYSAGRPSRWALAHILVLTDIIGYDRLKLYLKICTLKMKSWVGHWSRSQERRQVHCSLRRPSCWQSQR